MDVTKDQVSSLLDHGLYESAQMLGCFLISSTGTNVELSPHAKAENLVLLGDALYGEKEYKRALNQYKQAWQHCKVNPKQNTSTTRSSICITRSSSPNSLNISTINEHELKFKIALCHSALCDNRAALTELEGIPYKARTLRMNLILGRLCRVSRQNRAATAAYKECLRTCPYVLEAIVGLADLGVSAKEILSLFPQTLSRGGRPPSDHFDVSRWLQRYVEAHCCIASNDYKGALEHFSDILQRFPNNVHILLEIAKVEAITGKNEEAILNFEKVRSIDPYVITYMDEYAMLLKTKTDQSKLNRVVHELVNIDPSRVEVCVAFSVLWDRKNEKGRALAYTEKSLRIDDRHITAHIMKGNVFLSMNRPDAAVTAFRSAQELRPDLRSYQGLVRSYLALNKTKEALCVAREAMKAMPQSAKALTLVGDVYFSHPSGIEKARKFYESALRLERGYLGAALALADLHVMEGRHGDAISLLERYLNDWEDDSLHTKLAQIFSKSNMLLESVTHYQTALSINPQNDAAKKGLERLDKQMKGMDPDAPEDDEENEVEDGEGDHEETELL
ncbi:hypothetical protein AMTRI_Chr02g264590 [Amborella trichopoda]|uniref:Anaphase-promoting complex subunit 7 n=1 Tax=Amborella trichopoda TaxID=13333 RepID=U5D656_AMBTC|nr:anaphase-promoting complex subunit 7 [Amborella trichopoda]ERN16912.1 hypothetical protein AMTR_s00057p00169950 [Amborella trichopoda]|eukprot:XP_006855445.1 anaphase-promoting complex subunit 7 [Amborella trichopoda]